MSERASTKGRERPILFSAPMVRALLDGRKTQTRRILKQPYGTMEWLAGEWKPIATKIRAGDTLWVRESLKRAPDLWTYSADGAQVGWPARQALAFKQQDYAPSIHMPKAASRLTLIVTDVRVQRLQEISEEDARAEGAPDFAAAFGADDIYPATGETNREISDRLTWCKRWYSHLWDDINGAGSWEANPWVAAYTFTVERRNIDAGLGQRADATPNPLSEGRERS